MKNKIYIIFISYIIYNFSIAKNIVTFYDARCYSIMSQSTDMKFIQNLLFKDIIYIILFANQYFNIVQVNEK